MNCPKCKSGVLEKIGKIPLEGDSVGAVGGPLVIVDYFDQSYGIDVLTCSIETCGYTHFKTVPGTLSESKRILYKKASSLR